jgi:hypothetical protein
MRNNNKIGDSMSGIAMDVGGISIDVRAGVNAPVVKPVLETVVVKSPVEEPMLVGHPLAELPLVDAQAAVSKSPAAIEIGGAKGPEPTRYGDWEHKGRCYDF